MPNTSFATTLRSIGLPEREITVYLTLLELGDSPAALIAQKSGRLGPRSGGQSGQQ